MRKVGMAIAAALAALALVGSQAVMATHTPADKVVAAGSKVVVSGPNVEVPILSATLRSSKPSDLILSVSLECSILTRLRTASSENGGTSTALAHGQIRVWVEIDNQIVPINSVGGGEPGNETDKVTFCDRAYQRTVTDAENPLDGQDVEEDYIDTKNANAFNWLRLNVGAGVHTIVVKATLLQETQGDATAQAVIGNRSLIVEPAKLANDATI